MDSWLVYQYETDKKPKAVKLDWTTKQIADLEKSGAKILGTPVAKTESGAINYIETLLSR